MGRAPPGSLCRQLHAAAPGARSRDGRVQPRDARAQARHRESARERRRRLSRRIALPSALVGDPWYQRYAMWNSIGQSIEETRFMTSMIYEGVLDRFPGLKIIVAHGGGYMPHYMGRLDRNVTDKPETARNIGRMPSAYLRDFYYDSCVYDPSTLTALIQRVGADRIVMGSDYPVGDPEPARLLGLAESMAKSDLSMIMGGTAARLLGID